MAPTQDEAFHEIQLNGKQLVFLFMAATVVSVVIFLCGVLVGRNVRAERANVDVASVEPPVPASTPSSVETPRAYSDLGRPTPKDALKKPEPEPPAPAPAKAVVEKPDDKPAVTTSPATEKNEKPDKVEKAAPTAEKPPARPNGTAGTAAAESGTPGFAVQIAAVNAKSEADAMAKRLTSKGYSAYVLAPASGTPSVYRVRVGKFPTKREAETVAAKLQKEEQLKPWVTR